MILLTVGETFGEAPLWLRGLTYKNEFVGKYSVARVYTVGYRWLKKEGIFMECTLDSEALLKDAAYTATKLYWMIKNKLVEDVGEENPSEAAVLKLTELAIYDLRTSTIIKLVSENLDGPLSELASAFTNFSNEYEQKIQNELSS